MKWITREHAKVDRIACPWLIKNFVDKEATFLFVPPHKVLEIMKNENGVEEKFFFVGFVFLSCKVKKEVYVLGVSKMCLI